jgi:hypothetical protein
MLGQDAAQEIWNVPFSNSRINTRTDDMSHDAKEVLRDERKNNNFYIQDYESTNFTNKVML